MFLTSDHKPSTTDVGLCPDTLLPDTYPRSGVPTVLVFSSPNTSGSHNIVEKLLKVMIKTITK